MPPALSTHFSPKQSVHLTHTASTRSNVNMPTDSQGNLTGHLIGLLYRALFTKEMGIQTVWVFDGKPPRQKSD